MTPNRTAAWARVALPPPQRRATGLSAVNGAGSVGRDGPLLRSPRTWAADCGRRAGRRGSIAWRRHGLLGVHLGGPLSPT
jgi:hypothetical protein